MRQVTAGPAAAPADGDTCPPWCAYGPGCASPGIDDDRRHLGATFDIPLSTEPLERDLRVGPDGLEVFETDDPQTINARLDQHVSAAEPLVRLFSGEGTMPSYAVGMTLDEAERFGRDVLHLVAAARAETAGSRNRGWRRHLRSARHAR